MADDGTETDRNAQPAGPRQPEAGERNASVQDEASPSEQPTGPSQPRYYFEPDIQFSRVETTKIIPVHEMELRVILEGDPARVEVGTRNLCIGVAVSAGLAFAGMLTTHLSTGTFLLQTGHNGWDINWAVTGWLIGCGGFGLAFAMFGAFLHLRLRNARRKSLYAFCTDRLRRKLLPRGSGES